MNAAVFFVVIVVGYLGLVAFVVMWIRAGRSRNESSRPRGDFDRSVEQAMAIPNGDADHWTALDELQARRAAKDSQ